MFTLVEGELFEGCIIDLLQQYLNVFNRPLVRSTALLVTFSAPLRLS